MKCEFDSLKSVWSESDSDVGISHESPDNMKKVCNCKATILIVDDNSFNLMPLRHMLE